VTKSTAGAASPSAAAVDLLRTTGAVRERAGQLLARARRGESAWFTVHDSALDATAGLVREVTLARYPDLNIPFHSRWRHFEAGGVPRRERLDAARGAVDAAERARTQIDLALVSVLLDAGAGPSWRYHEATSGEAFTRSEGLGVASFDAFMRGLFSSDAKRPLQADAAGLQAVTVDALAAAFHVSPSNPLVGLEGRVALLRRLGDALAAQPEVFGADGRVGALYDHLLAQRSQANGPVHAHNVLGLLLSTLSGVWPAANALGSVPLGDCWQHPAVQGPGLSAGWMPFHKLSQWLTYSLLEPLMWSGVQVSGLDALTGLPEYRNGGLLLDAGVLRFARDDLAAAQYRAGDELIVEWRALTVALLDELAPRVRGQLGLTEVELPLACVLEGGTWAAGRALAQRLRGGTPPLNIESDGTVF
jgi:Protein of unknown function (DUF1688)